MQTSKFISLATCLCVSMLVSACDKKKDDAPAPTATSAPAAAPATAAKNASAQTAEPASQDKVGATQQDDDVNARLGEYIDCYNALDNQAYKSIARYRSWVKDMAQGPSGKEMVVYGLYTIDVNKVAKCKASFGKLGAKPNKLDSAAVAFIDSLSELGALVEEANLYYDRENYKDDGFAKGKAMHAPLANAMKKFQTQSSIFSEEIEIENDRVLDAEMHALEKKEGRQLPYLRMALMNKAKHLIRLIAEDEFDATPAAALLADYESLTDEAIAYVKKNTADVGSRWSSLGRATEDYRKAAKERVRRIRDKVPYNDGEKMMLKPGSAWMVEGSQEKVIKAYNGLVEASNRADF